MDCKNCKKKLELDTNFCPRCGYKQNIPNKCPICLEIKSTKTLVCGHNVCSVCIKKSYKTKKQCPVCRVDIEECPECYNFRLIKKSNNKKQCLDCKSIIISMPKIKKEDKIICRECRSNRILFNPDKKIYECMDCFGYFPTNIENQENQQTQIVTIPKTKICMKCFSNEIEFYDYSLFDNDNYNSYTKKNKCKNCLLENVEVKTISLEEFSKLKIKTKEEVNPTIYKLCPKCNSKDIYNLSISINDMDNCNTCKEKFLVPKIIKS